MNKLHGYKIVIEQVCVESHRSDEEWGDWSATYSNTLNSHVVKDDTYPDVVSTHDLEGGKNALVVWVEYSSGDSFGFGTNSGVEPIGLFVDIKSAMDLKEQIKSHDCNKNNSYTFKTQDGQIFKSDFAPWAGYFERLEEVHIDTVTVW